MDESIDLLDELVRGGPTASLFTTFNAWLPFYEEVVLRKLRNAGCEHNVLLMDGDQCAQSLAREAARPALAGRAYTLIPVRAPAIFHPKVAIVANSKRARMFVGSHNSTLSGFGMNREATISIDAKAKSDRDEAAAIRAALRAVRAWSSPLPRELDRVLSVLEETVDWMPRGESRAGDLEFLGSTREGPSLWSALRERIGGPVERVVIIAPYFDDRFEFIRAIERELDPRAVVVGVDAAHVALASREFSERVRFVDVGSLGASDDRGSSRFLHAKALWIEASEPALVVGSANASVAAWMASPAQRNDEAVLLLRGDRARDGVASLGLERVLTAPALSSTQWSDATGRHVELERSTLRARARVRTAFVSGDTLVFDSLDAERARDLRAAARLLDADGALLSEQTVTALGERACVQVAGGVSESACALELRWLDGEREVLLVHHTERLRAGAAPGRKRELNRALTALDGDPAQLASLLELVHKVVFDDDVEHRAKSRARGAGTDEAARAEAPLPDRLVVATSVVMRDGRRRLGSGGDLALLLDALIRRLGQGIDRASPQDDEAGEEELAIAASPERGAPPSEVAVVTPSVTLAKLCQRKVRTLCQRLARQVEDVTNDVTRVFEQMAAVLSLVRQLAALEHTETWRWTGQPLVNKQDLEQLFESLSKRCFCGERPLIRDPSVSDEPVEERSAVLGLLAWSAWFCGVDRRTIESREDDAVAAARRLARLPEVLHDLGADNRAQEIAEDAIAATAKSWATAQGWIDEHSTWTERVFDATSAPERLQGRGARIEVGEFVARVDGEGVAQRPLRMVLAVNRLITIDAPERAATIDLAPDAGADGVSLAKGRWVAVVV